MRLFGAGFFLSCALFAAPAVSGDTVVPEFLQTRFFIDLPQAPGTGDDNSTGTELPFADTAPLINFSPDSADVSETVSGSGVTGYGFAAASVQGEAFPTEPGFQVSANVSAGTEVFSREFFTVTPEPGGDGIVTIEVDVIGSLPGLEIASYTGNNASSTQTIDIDFYDVDFDREGGILRDRRANKTGRLIQGTIREVDEFRDPPIEDIQIVTNEPYFTIDLRIQAGIDASYVEDVGPGSASVSNTGIGYRFTRISGGTVQSMSGHDYTDYDALIPEPRVYSLLAGIIVAGLILRKRIVDSD